MTRSATTPWLVAAVMAATAAGCWSEAPVVPPEGPGAITVRLDPGWRLQAVAKTRSDVAKVRLGLVRVEGTSLKVVAVQEIALMGPQVAVRFHGVPVGVYRAAAVALDREGTTLNPQGPTLSANVATVQEGKAPLLSAGEALVITLPLADATFASLPLLAPGVARLGAAQLEYQLIDVYGGRLASIQRVNVGAAPPAGVIFHNVPNGVYQAGIIATGADGTLLAQLTSSNLAIVSNYGASVQWTASDAFAIPLP
jgi:hypothetical protein